AAAARFRSVQAALFLALLERVGKRLPCIAVNSGTDRRARHALLLRFAIDEAHRLWRALHRRRASTQADDVTAGHLRLRVGIRMDLPDAESSFRPWTPRRFAFPFLHVPA